MSDRQQAAFDPDDLIGAFAVIAMRLNAVMTALIAPVLLRLL